MLLGDRRGAGVAGRHRHRVYVRVSAKGQQQGMLTGTGTDNENAHGIEPIGQVGRSGKRQEQLFQFGLGQRGLTLARAAHAIAQPAGHDMLLAEYDYDQNLTPSFPLLDPTKPHRSFYVKKYGLPFRYWNLMLKGLA